MNQMCLVYKTFQKKIPNIKNIALFQLLEPQENNQVIYFSLHDIVAQVFSSEFCESFKSTYPTEHLWEIAFA